MNIEKKAGPRDTGYFLFLHTLTKSRLSNLGCAKQFIAKPYHERQTVQYGTLKLRPST